ncbi:ppsC, partial [Symbiodinium natans]
MFLAGTCVYATAWNALHWKARISKGERVLIHSAAGGVGLAAFHLCKRAGCKIYCTASTAEKRKLLLELGAAAVFNSRDPIEFEQGVNKATAGEGVDVVLNSLSGEAIPASLRLLRACGSFLEIGKREQYENKPLHMQAFLKGISFHAAHLDVLMLRKPDLSRRLLLEVWEALPQLPTLPTKTFGMSDLAGALEYFSKGVHVGKILVAVEPCEVRPRCPSTVAGPKDDVVRQCLQAMLAASEGPGGVLCAPTIDSVTAADLQSAELVLTASPAVSAAAQVLNPEVTCVRLPSWEPVLDLDDFLCLGGHIVAIEEETEGDLYQWLLQTVADMSGPIQLDMSFEDAGLDSLSLISLSRRLTSKINKAVSVANLSDHPTPRRLLEFLGGRPQSEIGRPKVLCAHGFRSNADAMAASMGPLISRVGFVEWLFISSPRAASGPAAPGIVQAGSAESPSFLRQTSAVLQPACGKTWRESFSALWMMTGRMVAAEVTSKEEARECPVSRKVWSELIVGTALEERTGAAVTSIGLDLAWWGQPSGPFETGWMAPHFNGFESSIAAAWQRNADVLSILRYAMTYLNDAQVLQGLKLAGAVGFSQGGGVAALLEHGMAKCILQNRLSLGSALLAGCCSWSSDERSQVPPDVRPSRREPRIANDFLL